VLELEDLCVPITEEAMERMMLSCELDLLIVELGVRDIEEENDAMELNRLVSPDLSMESLAVRETVGTGGIDAMPRPSSGEEGSSSFLEDDEPRLA